MSHIVNYAVMSPLTHMVVVNLTYMKEHLLKAVLVHWVTHCQVDSMA